LDLLFAQSRSEVCSDSPDEPQPLSVKLIPTHSAATFLLNFIQAPENIHDVEISAAMKRDWLAGQ
jgi:hypothetical protein